MNIREQLSTIHRNLAISYDKGERLGHVTNIYFEKSSCSIKGLSIAPKLIKTEHEVFVSFKDIHRLGKSVVIISSQTDLKKAPKKLEGSSLRNLKGTKIVTENGKHLGELLDVNVFAKSGIISDIVLYGSKKLKIDVEKNKISIGPDMIIVPAGYENKIETHKNFDKARFIANAEKTTRSVTESIKSAVLSVTTPKKAKENDKEPAKKELKKSDPAVKKTDQAKTGSKSKPSPSPAKKQVAKKTAATPSRKRPSKKIAKKVPGK